MVITVKAQYGYEQLHLNTVKGKGIFSLIMNVPIMGTRALVILEIVSVVIFLSLQEYMFKTVAVELYKHLWGSILQNTTYK